MDLPVPRNFTFWTDLPPHAQWAIPATWTKGRSLSLCTWSGWMVRKLDRGRPTSQGHVWASLVPDY